MFNFLKNLFSGEPAEKAQSTLIEIGCKGLEHKFTTRNPEIPGFSTPRHFLMVLFFHVGCKQTFTLKEFIAMAGTGKMLNNRIQTTLNRMEKKGIIKKIAKNKWTLLI